MKFHERLINETADARQGLLAAPIIGRALMGEIDRSDYLRFLHEAYHHVRHTVPLLRACRDALPSRLDWMLPAMEEYIAEEEGHDDWILDDIRFAGGDAGATRDGDAGMATEVMVAYAYDTIRRVHPLGFLGMVHVLEGTSAALALQAADSIQKRLGLPDRAMTYLRSHGHLDQDHTDHFATLVDALTDESDLAAIVHGARVFYRLYGDVFRSLDEPARTALPAAEAA